MFKLHFTDDLRVFSKKMMSVEVFQKYDFIFSFINDLLNDLSCLNLRFIAFRVVHIDYDYVFDVMQM